jgi:predicted Ser/Thr protein kinase
MACPSRGQLEAFARGLAEPDAARELSRHLDQCAVCRDEVEKCRRAVTSPRPQVAPGTIALVSADQTADSAARPTLTRPPDLINHSSPAAAFPGYDILKELHRGGQGIVYQAIQRSTKRKVAIKVVKEGPFASRGEKLRFEREVAILAQLRHANIVSIHDSGEAGGCAYYVMDYIRGEALDRWLAQNPRTVEEKLRLFFKIASAVGVAHLRGVTHRDLKPGNVLVDERGEPHILDFGLAKTAGGMDTTLMTRTGQFMGSLPWASPEQAEALPEKIDVRSDVYSLGVMLYQMLTGQFPYDVTGNMCDVLKRIMHAEPRRPRTVCREVRRELETILLACLEKQPQRRYKTAGELAEDIGRYLAGEPIRQRAPSVRYVAEVRVRRLMRRQPALTILLGLGLVALAANYLFRPLVYRWTPLNDLYLKALARLPVSHVPDLEAVRVIALTDRTDVSGLARAAGLQGVDPANLSSLRRLHGALLERLADSDLGAMVSDIAFRGPSEFDDDLLRGIRAIRARGRDVIVSVGGWKLGQTELPAFSPGILEEVKWAAATGDFSSDLPWSLDLFIERPPGPPVPALALMAVAADLNPGAEMHLQRDGRTQAAMLNFWRPDRAAPLAKQWVVGPTVHFTGCWALPEDDDTQGLRQGDRVGEYLVTIPADDVLKRCTLEYQDVFVAHRDRLRTWFRKRIVLLADLREDFDRYPYPDGRFLPGVYAHAVAIGSLKQDIAIRAPTNTEGWAVIALAVLAGGSAAYVLYRSKVRLVIALALLVPAMILAGVGAFQQVQYLVNPIVPASATLLSAALVALVRRQQRMGGV